MVGIDRRPDVDEDMDGSGTRRDSIYGNVIFSPWLEQTRMGIRRWRGADHGPVLIVDDVGPTSGAAT
jgi:hypothetical protein